MLGPPVWIFPPGLARPGSKSRNPWGLQPGWSHCFSPHCPGLLQTPPSCQPRPCRACHEPGALCPHLSLLSQPGPPLEHDVGVKGQIWDREPDKGERLRLGHPICPKLGKTNGIREFWLGYWSTLEFSSNSWKDISNKSSEKSYFMK